MSIRRTEEQMETPMSAMIDVVFLLLIFFIVTHKEEQVEAHMAINLPAPGAASAPSNKPNLLEVHVYNTFYTLNGKQLGLDTLEEKLLGLAMLDSDQTVIIKVSREAFQRELVELLDRCQKAGFKNLNVLTLK
ncbi:MAG TPA: hypothetical protein DCR55_12300 [Lentisphaeria bacterium]|nr:hypothetical protein [Lentisphaeria bacterium]